MSILNAAPICHLNNYRVAAGESWWKTSSALKVAGLSLESLPEVRSMLRSVELSFRVGCRLASREHPAEALNDVFAKYDVPTDSK